jgi:nitrite reductase/ring-hydroxylating ferredoxin subunit/alkylhydroperoxidase/carboxymuconolactone decarboxylase family protein YurZ
MSDALAYLVKARPDAVSHYFAFLKQCGTHLDPKTRNLISVITKVDAQTSRGFRQYLNRALREGCTPMEVLDALLMAFPTLGLAKIVWAVDQILEMGIPEFDPAALHGRSEWRDVGEFKSLKDGEVRRTEAHGRGLFLYRQGRSVTVYDSRCPHQGTDMPELALQGRTLTCPKHDWAFDAHTGECIKTGNSPLKRLPAKVVKGRVMAQW